MAEPFLEMVAIVGILAYPAFYVPWAYLFPQPYESLTLRLVGAALLVPLALRRLWPERVEPALPYYWQLISLYLMFFFAYMSLRNDMNIIWLLSMIGATFLLTFFVVWSCALVHFVTGTTLAWAAYQAGDGTLIGSQDYVQHLVINAFPLMFGLLVNHRMQRYRAAQASFEKRLRDLSNLNSRIIQEQNELLSRFLSNSIVARLRNHQKAHGLEAAFQLVTKQEQRFCGIMQADIRNFTRMFGYDSEIEVAQLVRRCFMDITEVGQDIAVLKPVGDCIFLYSDDANGEDTAIQNILALAIVFVNAVSDINTALSLSGQQPLNFGVAVHGGPVVYGNLASENFIDPTIIGVNVNKTARLEELTKSPALQELAGSNAIILSKEVKARLGGFMEGDDLVTVNLEDIGLQVRDFPDERRVYVLRQGDAAQHKAKALQYIDQQRRSPGVARGRVDRYTHNGLSYFYELEGAGPDSHWSVIIDVTPIPSRLCQRYATEHLTDLDCQFNRGEGQWLLLSTAQYAGEWDELDVEERIIEIINDLQGLAAN